MQKHPNLSCHGYQIDGELGRNREGGRITWRGIDLESKKTVAIKQFCFASANSSWSGYKAHKREIEILTSLNHPSIPQYLHSIETEDGFCLIQEYIFATQINKFRQLTVAEVKQVALKILDILVYLQHHNPPIIHRDIKPDNILLDEKLNVYLIDFGFASLGSLEVSGSSVFKGTPGFIAPEQVVKPVLASDIYSLGITLVCLLSQKNIAEIRDFTIPDDPYQLALKPLLPDLDRQLLNWLEQMTNAKVSKRFSDATTARKALLSLESSSNLSPTSTDGLERAISRRSQLIVGTLGIFIVSTITAWSIDFVAHQLELTISNIAIAIIAAIAIGVTELGAISLAEVEGYSQPQGLLLATIMPTVLVLASGFIWGIEEAVIIATAIAMVEIVILSYFWWQIPIWQNKALLLKVSCWISSILIGMTLGWQIL